MRNMSPLTAVKKKIQRFSEFEKSTFHVEVQQAASAGLTGPEQTVLHS